MVWEEYDSGFLATEYMSFLESQAKYDTKQALVIYMYIEV